VKLLGHIVAASSLRRWFVNHGTLRKLGIVVNAVLLLVTPHAASAQRAGYRALCNPGDIYDAK
jgi:hypothetical protein